VIVSHEAEPAFNFHALLFELDATAADRVRADGCPHCEGPLYWANYERKARGLGEGAATLGRYELRLSLCCGREGCRRRATPPSTRFSGRRVYAAIAVLALSLSGAERAAGVEVGEVVERRSAPARSTRERWLSWWRCELLSEPWFVALCAQLAEPVDGASAPDSLLAKFTGTFASQARALIAWLSPLTTRSLSYERSRISMAH
jgi:hypothetical protein